ncbi:hypothetical protein [Methylacidimicrobium sp. B4]|uniref:hypothetical protein n=1 Tax=Methylacidimicrobium sp. B4 TaxID=2796139 RepID=UPI001A8D3527|nr:hypothetical protein [Methylacidimicrobium sp. B4]QSR84558.1 hypothetical protein MacB4_10230 [Methylacidimicrobium sp. B4]
MIHPSEQVRTKFGEAVDEIVNLSPHGRWLFQQADKYEIDWGVPGGGSYTIRHGDRGVIAIDPELKGNPAAVAAALFHELGHATYHPPRVDGDLAHELERLEIEAPKEVGRWVGNLVGKGKEGAELGKRLGFGIEKATEDGCVAWNVNQDLTDEGHAEMTRIICCRQAKSAAKQRGDRRLEAEADEALRFLGNEVVQRGNRSWEQMQKVMITRQGADFQLGQWIGDHLHPSTDPNSTYRDYYEKGEWANVALSFEEKERLEEEPAPGGFDGNFIRPSELSPYQPWVQSSCRVDPSRYRDRGRGR